MSPKLSPPPRRGALVEQHWEPRMDAMGGRAARRGFTFEAYVPRRSPTELPARLRNAAAAANAEAARRELNEEPPEPGNFETLARQLLRAESVASSRIEGLIPSHPRLAKAAFSGTHDITAQSVLANIRALERAVDLAGVSRRWSAATWRRCTGSSSRGRVTRHAEAGSAPSITGSVDRPRARATRSSSHRRRSWSRTWSTTSASSEPGGPASAIRLASRTSSSRRSIPSSMERPCRPGADPDRPAAPRPRPELPATRQPVPAGEADRYAAGLGGWRRGDEDDWYRVFIDALYRAAAGARNFATDVVGLQERWLAKAGDPRRGRARAADRACPRSRSSTRTARRRLPARLLRLHRPVRAEHNIRRRQSHLLPQLRLRARLRAGSPSLAHPLPDGLRGDIGQMAAARGGAGVKLSVIGAGPAYLAILMKKAGHDITVLERNVPDASDLRVRRRLLRHRRRRRRTRRSLASGALRSRTVMSWPAFFIKIARYRPAGPAPMTLSFTPAPPRAATNMPDVPADTVGNRISSSQPGLLVAAREVADRAGGGEIAGG